MSPRRIGLAATDPGRRLVTPLATFSRRDPDRDLARIEAEVRRRGAVGLVVGYPLSMDGREGPQARMVKAFAEQLASRLGLPVYLQDERLTTFAVEQAVREGRLPRPRPKGPLDHYAAAVILEDALAAFARARRQRPR